MPVKSPIGYGSLCCGYRLLSFKQKNKWKRIFEHRYIIENKLKRKLKRNEVVHHKDGNRLNNSISNLQVMTRREHIIEHFGTRENCSIENCENKHFGLGFCIRHYRRFKIYGSPYKFKRERYNGEKCPAKGCKKIKTNYGFCWKHGRNFKSYGSPYRRRDILKCKIINCHKKFYSKGVCKKHYKNFQ